MQREGSRDGGRVVVGVEDLEAARDQLERSGFRLDAIYPADAPRVLELSGWGLHVELRQTEAPATTRLSLPAEARAEGELPKTHGLELEFRAEGHALGVPEGAAAFEFSAFDAGSAWGEGRAGMLYRDLLPSRWGGRFIASHIRIEEGGEVPDYVHHHRVRFQTIFCLRGWVRVVYEDQGEPFVLEAGDAVLQPPNIRHRVLACSEGLEVLELGCPAEHETRRDHVLTLPTRTLRPERDFGGQRFLRHQRAGAPWSEGALEGFLEQDVGVAAATQGLADQRVLRALGDGVGGALPDAEEFAFAFVRKGGGQLRGPGSAQRPISAGDAFAWAPGDGLFIEAMTAGSELVLVRLPAPPARAPGGGAPR